MLVAHVITGLYTGGAELMLKRLVASHVGNRDYRHVVFSLRDLGTIGPSIQELGVEVVPLGMKGPMRAPKVFARLVSELRSRKPDIVQTWMHHSDLIGGLAARAAGINHILWGVRIAEIGPHVGVSRATLLVRRLCSLLSAHVPERIIYVAHSARKVHEAVGYAPDKGIVIPNGYSVPERPEKNWLRSELGLPSDTLLIGSAGRFNPQKNHRSFIAAAAMVAEREPRARFVMMGPGIESWNSELVEWVKSSGFEDRFYLFGDQRDLVRWLAGLDLFCLHSLSEGFPNVVAEAMSAGVPCVVTDVGDAAFLVGATGTVVPPGDASALASAILSAVAGGPADRQACGAAARHRIIENFSMDAIRTRYEDLYGSLGAKPLDYGANLSAGELGRSARPAAAREDY